jgi:hypothetical protein
VLALRVDRDLGHPASSSLGDSLAVTFGVGKALEELAHIISEHGDKGGNFSVFRSPVLVEGSFSVAEEMVH